MGRREEGKAMTRDKDIILGKAVAEERKVAGDKYVVLGKKAAYTK